MLKLDPYSTKNKFRGQRVFRLKELISKIILLKGNCRLLYIGGTQTFWNTWEGEFSWSNLSVVCVNLPPLPVISGSANPKISVIEGDACDLHNIADHEYDIVFSNSVIEHVGMWRSMVEMANEISRVAPRYFVQTPYFWFPVEPHARFPFIHWLPQSIAYRIVKSRKNGFWPKAETSSEAVKLVQSAQMIDFTQMKELFPDAIIIREKFLGLTKSLLAIRD